MMFWAVVFPLCPVAFAVFAFGAAVGFVFAGVAVVAQSAFAPVAVERLAEFVPLARRVRARDGGGGVSAPCPVLAAVARLDCS